MKTCWLHAAMLLLLVSLSPLATQVPQFTVAMPAHALPPVCDHISSSDRCWDCCLECDEFAAAGICSFLCVAAVALPRPTISVAVRRGRGSLWTLAATWVHSANPPDPYPPKQAYLV